MQRTVTDFQLQNVLETLQTIQGLAALAMFLLLLVLTGLVKQTRWMVISLLLFVSSLGYFRWSNLTLVSPFQQMRDNGRGICFALLIVLLVPTILASRGWRYRLIAGALVSYFLFELVYSSRLMFGTDFTKGFFAVITFALTFITLGIGLARWLQSPKEAAWAIWSIALGGAIFTLGTCLQLAVNMNAVVWNNRLLGLTGNPQHAAVLLAISIPACWYLLIRRGGSKLLRIGLIAALIFMKLLLVWTGSRTGFWMAALGIVLTFRVRLGRFAVSAVLSAIGLYFAFRVFADSLIGADRLLSSQDTRTGVWLAMLDDFMASPWLGDTTQVRASENSYLLAATQTGLVGLIPLLLSIILVVRMLVRLQRIRRYLGTDALMADYVMAGIISIGAGAMFEGHLLAVYSFPMYSLYILLGLAAFLIDYATVGELGETLYAYPSEPREAGVWPPQPALAYGS